MKHRVLILTFFLGLMGCTFTPQDNGVKAAFEPPLVERHWSVDHTVLPNGTKVCSISSGYNGITVFLSNEQGTRDVAVKSNRIMQPGATLTVNAGGSSVESYDSFFPPAAAQALFANLSKGGTMYLEWSEFSGTAGRERAHIQNIVPLGDFSSHVKECQDALHG